MRNSAIVRATALSITVLLAVAVTGLGIPRASIRGETSKAGMGANSADLYEAVLRYQITTWELAAAAYCVKIQSKDADKDFLKRLEPLPVKGASGCRRQTPTKLKVATQVVDKKTKKNAVIFSLGDIRRLNESEAEVEGGYDCGDLCGAAGTYKLKRNGARWNVTDFRIFIQS